MRSSNRVAPTRPPRSPVRLSNGRFRSARREQRTISSRTVCVRCHQSTGNEEQFTRCISRALYYPTRSLTTLFSPSAQTLTRLPQLENERAGSRTALSVQSLPARDLRGASPTSYQRPAPFSAIREHHLLGRPHQVIHPPVEVAGLWRGCTGSSSLQIPHPVPVDSAILVRSGSVSRRTRRTTPDLTWYSMESERYPTRITG